MYVCQKPNAAVTYISFRRDMSDVLSFAATSRNERQGLGLVQECLVVAI